MTGNVAAAVALSEKTVPNPSLGRIVHYTLTEQDAALINKRRADYVASFGNRAEAGQVYAGLIVRVWPGGYTNLQVFLDGNDVLWVTSVLGGEGEGRWIWPPRV